MTQPEVTPEEVLAFLNGQGPLDGRWFDDKVPLRWGKYWWRKHLPVLAVQSTQLTDEVVETFVRKVCEATGVTYGEDGAGEDTVRDGVQAALKSRKLMFGRKS